MQQCSECVVTNVGINSELRINWAADINMQVYERTLYRNLMNKI